MQTSPPSKGGVWLVPAHVPDHWTLVAICWDLAEIRFYDSLPECTTATADEKVVRDLMYVDVAESAGESFWCYTGLIGVDMGIQIGQYALLTVRGRKANLQVLAPYSSTQCLGLQCFCYN